MTAAVVPVGLVAAGAYRVVAGRHLPGPLGVDPGQRRLRWSSAQTHSKDLAPRSRRLFSSTGTEAIWAADDEGPVALVNLLSKSVH